MFQHFTDREALFAAISERQYERVEPLMAPVPAEGPLAERLDALVAQRAAVYELIAPVRRAALLMEPFSDHIGAALGGFRERKRLDAIRVLGPELRALPGERRSLVEAALGASASWSAWDVLRTQQGLGRDRAAAVMRATLHALVTAS